MQFLEQQRLRRCSTCIVEKRRGVDNTEGSTWPLQEQFEQRTVSNFISRLQLSLGCVSKGTKIGRACICTAAFSRRKFRLLQQQQDIQGHSRKLNAIWCVKGPTGITPHSHMPFQSSSGLYLTSLPSVWNCAHKGA